MKKICIELHTDNNYVMPTIVTIASLLLNKKKTSQYEIRVLGNNLSQENTTLLKKQLNGYGKVIPHISHFSKFEGTHPHVSSTDLFKFDLPEVLSDWDKVLYIDTDMIIQGDLSELFNIDLGDNYIAAVKDMAGMVLENTHGFVHLKNYFNAGMMLMNLKKMRKEQVGEKLIQYKLHQDRGHFMSQDALNAIFQEKVIWVEPKYNFMGPNLAAFTDKQIADFYGIKEESVLNLLKDALIVHLTNRQKPWNYTKVYGHDLWMRYFRSSVLKHKTLEFQDIWNPKIIGWSVKGTVQKFYLCKIPLIRIETYPNKTKIYFLNIRIRNKKKGKK